MFVAALETGMRAGELAGLQWEDIILIIKLYKNGTVTCKIEKQKGKKAHKIKEKLDIWNNTKKNS